MSHELVAYDGKVFTAERGQPWAQAVATRDGCIVYVGESRRARELVSQGAESIDLRGRLLLPGFCDSHVHFLGTGFSQQMVDLRGMRSLEEALARVAEEARRSPRGQWIRGRGWDQNEWGEPRFPEGLSLDNVAPGNPVVLWHHSGHALWANSAALAAAGITADSPDPPGGQIGRDAESGEPTGILWEAAQRAIVDAMPRPSREERVTAARAAVTYAQSLGVTAVHDMGTSRSDLDVLEVLRDEGELGVRVHAYLAVDRLEDFIAAGLRTGSGDSLLRIGGVKIIADGALGAQSALMLGPFAGQPENSGIATLPVEELRNMVRRAADAGLATAVHAIGDRANRQVLDIYEQELGANHPLRPRIEHCQLLHPDDIPRFGRLGVLASVQPIHATSDMTMADRLWGERCAGAYAYRSLLDTGAHLTMGSDCPVEPMDVLANIHAAVTRRRADGRPPQGWYPGQRLSVEEAVLGFTLGPAFAAGAEATQGSVKQGKAADLVVLSQDIFSLADPMDILRTRVHCTIFDGRVVFQREG